MYTFNKAIFFTWSELDEQIREWAKKYFGFDEVFAETRRVEYEYCGVVVGNLREEDKQKIRDLREQCGVTYLDDCYCEDEDFPLGPKSRLTLADKITRFVLSQVAGFDVTEDVACENGVYVLCAPKGADGICPLCHAEVEFGGDQQIVDDWTVVSWACPTCGAHGQQGSGIVFEEHFDVYDKNGNKQI